MQVERELNRLASEIQHLRVELTRFFNGATQLPPEDLRTQIQRQIRELRNANLQASADHFRLGSLEARFNSLNELFNRRLREREEGRGPQRGAASGSAHRHDPREGVVLDASTDSNAVEALYAGLQRKAGQGPQFDLDSFRNYLQKQITTLRKKTGCEQVQFRVSEEDGKMKLKAKPLGIERPGA